MPEMYGQKTRPKLVVVTGQTATGKSDLAVRLARRFGGEVISADSRQVYSGLDLGSGKITKREMRGVPHHLLDVASPWRCFGAARYQALAERAVRGVLARGKLPIVCGGTGFYVEALVDGVVLPEVPPDTLLRERLAKKSASELFKMLRRLDPVRAGHIDAKNPRRLIRAIEIARALGKVPPPERHERYDALFIGLYLPEKKLREKIRARLRARMRAGMAAEARRLHDNGLPWKRMEELGLEYRFLARYLEKKMAREEMLEKLETEIYRYAKRQFTWWKRDKRVRWLDASAKDTEEKAKALVSAFAGKPVSRTKR